MTVSLNTVASILKYRARKTASAVAISSTEGESWTFSELRDSAYQVACAIPIAHSERIGVVMENGPVLTISILGATLAGTAAPLNPAYKLNEFKRYIKRLNLTCLLLDEAQAEAAQAALELSVPVIYINLKNLSQVSRKLTDPKPNDIALILLTSGSTGAPKAVPLTHNNLSISASQVSKSVDLSVSDICLSMWELYHIGGLVDLLLAPVLSGGSIVATRGFDTALFFSSLLEYKPTWFQAVPTALNEIVSQAKRDNIQMVKHDLRFIRSVAAQLPESLRLEVEELFGIPVIQTFGMTEAGPLITSTCFSPRRHKVNSVGRSCGTKIKILGDGGKFLPVGEVGEVAIRGANVFVGYEGDEKENSSRFYKQKRSLGKNWFLTGDLGKLDQDGDLFLTGRSKNLINRGGEKINPLEVENILRLHIAVKEAAVFATEHKTLGEDVAAAVTIKSNNTCTESDLKKFLSERMIAFKVPYKIIFLDALPLTPVGKLDRPELVKVAASKLDVQAVSDLDEAETSLANIWATEMNLTKIGAEENFFSAGGDSLAGVRVLMAVEKWLGKPIPPSLMGEISTVRNMANKLRDEKALAPAKTYVPEKSSLIHHIELVMQSGKIPSLKGFPSVKYVVTAEPETTPPLFWCFNGPDQEMGNLLDSLPKSQTVYGLYSGSFAGQGRAKSEVISEVAQHYAKIIPLITEGRPFFIGGNCRGARIVDKLLELLEESNVSPVGVMFLEFGFQDIPCYPCPSMFIFGTSSAVELTDVERLKIAASKPVNQIQIVETSGAHGQFFNKMHIGSLTRHLQDFIQTQKAHEDSLL